MDGAPSSCGSMYRCGSEALIGWDRAVRLPKRFFAGVREGESRDIVEIVVPAEEGYEVW